MWREEAPAGEEERGGEAHLAAVESSTNALADGEERGDALMEGGEEKGDGTLVGAEKEGADTRAGGEESAARNF